MTATLLIPSLAAHCPQRIPQSADSTLALTPRVTAETCNQYSVPTIEIVLDSNPLLLTIEALAKMHRIDLIREAKCHCFELWQQGETNREYLDSRHIEYILGWSAVNARDLMAWSAIDQGLGSVSAAAVRDWLETAIPRIVKRAIVRYPV